MGNRDLTRYQDSDPYNGNWWHSLLVCDVPGHNFVKVVFVVQILSLCFYQHFLCCSSAFRWRNGWIYESSDGWVYRTLHFAQYWATPDSTGSHGDIGVILVAISGVALVAVDTTNLLTNHSVQLARRNYLLYFISYVIQTLEALEQFSLLHLA